MARMLTRTIAWVSLAKCAATAFSIFPKHHFVSLASSSSLSLSNAAIGAKQQPVSFSSSSSSSSSSEHNSFPTHPLTPTSSFSVDVKHKYAGEDELLVVPYKVDGDRLVFPGLASTVSNQESLSAIVNEITREMQLLKSLGTLDLETSRVTQIFPTLNQTKHIAFVNVPEQSDCLQLGKSIATIANQKKIKTVGVVLDVNSSVSISDMLMGVHEMMYDDIRFKGIAKSTCSDIHHIHIYTSQLFQQDIVSVKARVLALAAGVNLAKDIVGAPPNWKTPYMIASLIEKLASDYSLECKILGLDECLSLGMGGYLAVQQGSKFSPKFVHLTYKGKTIDGTPPTKIALIGKGLTFDSGGYNLKAGAGSMIELMKFDVGGGAAVFGCARAIGELKPENIEVHFISPLCENMISAESMRPGDIVKASNGKTIEIINTDAEGRLALADALCYAETLNVHAIVDVATLTGACIVGLGEHVAGLYSSHEPLKRALEEAAKRSQEKLWNLPLEKSYKKSLKSVIADLKNLSSAKGGGSITAALFLQEFVKSTPWAHLDIAGPVWDYSTAKPTGFGVKLLTEFVTYAPKFITDHPKN